MIPLRGDLYFRNFAVAFDSFITAKHDYGFFLQFIYEIYRKFGSKR
jgi:hypothetical protein